MPVINSRGKSALGTTDKNVDGSASHLLRIESVVPKLSTRNRKVVQRSYSTLSSSCVKKLTHHTRKLSKIHESTEKTAPGSAANLVTFQNGVYHINRTTKERIRQPDRINLDRRGLTTIPFIDEEPDLRLLSLQHNLINIFHVPRTPTSDDVVVGADGSSSGVMKCDADVGVKSSSAPPPAAPKSPTTPARPKIMKKQASARNLLPPKTPLLTATNGSYVGSNKMPTTTTSIASSSFVRNSFIQKSVLLHANQKFALKKSNSFINTYSQHLAATKLHLGKILNKSGNMSSFGSDLSLCEMQNSKDSDSGYVKSPPMVITNENPLHGFADNLKNLVFLDLYDNQIEKISTLDGLSSLTVLLLGKNRISDISGIVTLKTTLRVLDLHGNKVTNISQKVCQLQELKSLNLAGNLLKQIHAGDMAGLFNLKELNLKRNKIKKINGFDDLRNLERLWLCHNDLQKIEDMSCIAKAINLKEITIENNPVSLAGDCVSFLVSYLPSLGLLSQMQITEQVRRAAIAWRKNKEMSDANYIHLTNDVCQTIRREEVISNARTNWELLLSQQQISSKSKSHAMSQFSISVAGVEVNMFNEHYDGSQSDKAVIQNLANYIKQGKSMRGGVKTDVNEDNAAMSHEIFRLPPILAPFIDEQSGSKPTSSESSLGPNIDSSSSCYSSESELPQDNIEDDKDVVIKSIDNGSTSTIPDTAPKNCSTPKHQEELKPCAEVVDSVLQEPNNNPAQKLSDELVPSAAAKTMEDDKLSNLSISSKSPSEASNSANLTDDLKVQKSRSANANKRALPGSLVRSQTAKNHNSSPSVTAKPVKTNDREREQGGDFLIEICGRYLNVYGIGALKFMDKQWNVQKANDVHTIKFSYVNFNNIAGILYRIKLRFPNAENFVFKETNITCFGQLNMLAEIQGITSLSIDAEGNSIHAKDWRLYAIYRLSHWGLKFINGVDINSDEIEAAQCKYSSLSDLVLWALPESLLQPLLARLQLDETCNASKKTAKEWLLGADESLKSVVGKEALQWKRTQSLPDEVMIRQKGKTYFTSIIENTCNAVEKLQKLETLWPNLMTDIVRNSLLDYAQIDVYLKNLMADLVKQ